MSPYCENYKPTQCLCDSASHFFFFKIIIKRSSQKRMRAHRRKGEIVKEGQWNTLSISRITHKYCNCVVIEKEEVVNTVIDFEWVLCHLLNESDMNAVVKESREIMAFVNVAWKSWFLVDAWLGKKDNCIFLFLSVKNSYCHYLQICRLVPFIP